MGGSAVCTGENVALERPFPRLGQGRACPFPSPLGPAPYCVLVWCLPKKPAHRFHIGKWGQSYVAVRNSGSRSLVIQC